MTGVTPTPFRFGGTRGYRQDTSRVTSIRSAPLATVQGRWLTRHQQPAPSPPPIRAWLESGGVSSGRGPYVYAAGTPATVSVGTTPGSWFCEARSIAYCMAAIRGAGNPLAMLCICAAAVQICNIIKATPVGGVPHAWWECMNYCVYNHWVKKDTQAWRDALARCRNCKGGFFSAECCRAYIVADQSAVAACARQVCGPVPDAPAFRARFAALGCCDVAPIVAPILLP